MGKSADIRSRLREIDREIRQGNGSRAAAGFDAIAQAELPRPLEATYAWIAWRLGKADAGLRVLGKRVRLTGQLGDAPSSAELAEYAACLIYSGATAEATLVLERVPAADCPASLLYLGFARVSEWDYAGSLPFFTRFVADASTGAYRKLVGQINLAGALVYERRYLAAETLLRELVHETAIRRLRLLHGVALEFHAASLVLRGRHGDADRFLERSEKALEKMPGLDLFFAKKWAALSRLFQNPEAPAAREAVGAIRREAERRKHWETVRDCDRYVAIATGDRALALDVYFGTPFAAFRERLARDFSPGLRPPAVHSWTLGDGVPSGTIDLRGTPAAFAKKAGLKAGQLPHRMLATLGSDRYRPFTPGRLFQSVFPGERYLGASGLRRIQVAVGRCRKLFAEAGFPADVEVVGGAYRLRAKGGALAVKAGAEPARLGRLRSELLCRELRTEMGDRPFSIGDAIAVLGIPRRSLVRELAEACRAGLLQRTGKLKATRYHLAEGAGLSHD